MKTIENREVAKWRTKIELANELKEMQKISEATSEATFEATSLHLVYHVRACETYTDCHSVWYEKIERREGKPKYSVNESER